MLSCSQLPTGTCHVVAANACTALLHGSDHLHTVRITSTWLCCYHAQEKTAQQSGISVGTSGKGWSRDGVAYAIGDFVYVTPNTFSVTKEASKVETNAVPDYAAKGGHVKVQFPRCCCHNAAYIECQPCHMPHPGDSHADMCSRAGVFTLCSPITAPHPSTLGALPSCKRPSVCRR